MWCNYEGAIVSPCEYEHHKPDSLAARLVPFVVLAVAPPVTMDEASSLLPPLGILRKWVYPPTHPPPPGVYELARAIDI